MGTARAEKVRRPEIISEHWMGRRDTQEGTVPVKSLHVVKQISVILGSNLTVIHTITIYVITRIAKKKRKNGEIANFASVIFSLILVLNLTVIHTINTFVTV